MKAVIFTEYGSPEVLRLVEMEKPVPKKREILIRVRAASVGYGDLMARRFRDISHRDFNMAMPLLWATRLIFGWNKPKIRILGAEFAGEVEAVGSEVSRFQKGDQVFGYRGPAFGAYAEYLCVGEESLVAHKPKNMSFEEACAVPYGALTALSLLRRVKIEAGQRVLINGASGGIGSFALQFAKLSGAEVTGVCGTERIESVRSLGADHVIDYSKEDFTKRGEKYDLIFDVLGRCSFARCKAVLKEQGILLYASFKMRQLLQMLWNSRRGGQKVLCALSSEKTEDLDSIREWIEAGQLRLVVDRSFPLEEAAAAHRYLEAGHRKGCVNLSVMG